MPIEMVISLVGVLAGTFGSSVAAAVTAYLKRRMRPETEVRVENSTGSTLLHVRGEVPSAAVSDALESAGMLVDPDNEKDAG